MVNAISFSIIYFRYNKRTLCQSMQWKSSTCGPSEAINLLWLCLDIYKLSIIIFSLVPIMFPWFWLIKEEWRAPVSAAWMQTNAGSGKSWSHLLHPPKIQRHTFVSSFKPPSSSDQVQGSALATSQSERLHLVSTTESTDQKPSIVICPTKSTHDVE